MKKILFMLFLVVLAIVVVFERTRETPFCDNFSYRFAHPNDLVFGELNWQIPNANDFRKTIGNIPFFFERDDRVALFHFQLSFEAGSLLEYPQPSGTSALYALSIRNGGSIEFSPAEVDSLLALNAITIAVSSHNARTDFIVTGLSQHKEIALGILEDILQNPRFDEARVNLNRRNLAQNVAHRFNNPQAILAAGWRSLIYPNTQISELREHNFANKITRQDLRDYHSYLMNDARLVVAASGDIDEAFIRQFVERNFGLERNVNSRELAPILPSAEPKTLIIHRAGLTQSIIVTGMPSFMRPDERFYPLSVFNEILGGGFNSRLVSRIRSNYGLTYSIHSSLGSNYLFPATFNAQVSTQIEHTNRALSLMHEIITAASLEELTSEEVNEKTEQFILSLPSAFRTAEARVSTFLRDEFDGRSPTHYIDYVARMTRITADYVAQNARRFFADREFFTVVVTDTSRLLNVEEFSGFSVLEQNPIIITVDEFDRNLGRIK